MRRPLGRNTSENTTPRNLDDASYESVATPIVEEPNEELSTGMPRLAALEGTSSIFFEDQENLAEINVDVEAEVLNRTAGSIDVYTSDSMEQQAASLFPLPSGLQAEEVEHYLRLQSQMVTLIRNQNENADKIADLIGGMREPVENLDSTSLNGSGLAGMPGSSSTTDPQPTILKQILEKLFVFKGKWFGIFSTAIAVSVIGFLGVRRISKRANLIHLDSTLHLFPDNSVLSEQVGTILADNSISMYVHAVLQILGWN